MIGNDGQDNPACSVSGEVETGLREENASKQESRARPDSIRTDQAL
jgi:hypothetical protein